MEIKVNSFDLTSLQSLYGFSVSIIHYPGSKLSFVVRDLGY